MTPRERAMLIATDWLDVEISDEGLKELAGQIEGAISEAVIEVEEKIKTAPIQPYQDCPAVREAIIEHIHK